MILITNPTLSFAKAIELYQVRWTIGVLFKERKQYLRLGTCQNTDFDGQIADTTLVFITYTIFTLQRRFRAYETMGELFCQHQQHLPEPTFRGHILKVFLKMLRRLIAILTIDTDQTIELLFNNEKANKEILICLSALQVEIENSQNKHDSAA